MIYEYELNLVALINRNPSGRIICLHALTRTLYQKFHNKNFTIKDLKYNSSATINITDCCDLLIESRSIEQKVCPYLKNPLSNAKCYLTQSVEHDTQKSKSASDTMNALDGLGFVTRDNNSAHLTQSGIKFATCDFVSEKWLDVARSAVLRYGPFIGLLHEIKKTTNKSQIRVSRRSIDLGYPKTNESIMHEGEKIQLSTGSQADTNTRTRAVLFSWAVSTGFAIPDGHKVPTTSKLWHVSTKDFVEEPKWLGDMYTFFIPADLFNGKYRVERPLNFNWMTKSTRSLREKGQDEIRQNSLKFERIIKNRRFAITYVLANKAETNKTLNLRSFIKSLERYPRLFVINNNHFQKVIETELKIAVVCGIPYEYKNGNLKPLTKLNLEVLCKGADPELLEVLDKII